MYNVLGFVVLVLVMFNILDLNLLHGFWFLDDIFDEDILLIIIVLLLGISFLSIRVKEIGHHNLKTKIKVTLKMMRNTSLI